MRHTTTIMAIPHFVVAITHIRTRGSIRARDKVIPLALMMELEPVLGVIQEGATIPIATGRFRHVSTQHHMVRVIHQSTILAILAHMNILSTMNLMFGVALISKDRAFHNRTKR